MNSRFLNLFRAVQSKCIQNGSRRTFADWPPEKLRRNMEKFQKENGVPIYLKGGPSDKILFGVTVVIVIGGVIESYRSLFLLDKKK